MIYEKISDAFAWNVFMGVIYIVSLNIRRRDSVADFLQMEEMGPVSIVQQEVRYLLKILLIL